MDGTYLIRLHKFHLAELVFPSYNMFLRLLSAASALLPNLSSWRIDFHLFYETYVTRTLINMPTLRPEEPKCILGSENLHRLFFFSFFFENSPSTDVHEHEHSGF